MPYNFGSSSINITSNDSRGNTGPTGPTGLITGGLGNPGVTGECFTGGTGTGITSIIITGLTLQIIYGTGGYTFEISKNILRGPTGTTSSNNTYYNIRGTTAGFGNSLISTTDVVSRRTNSVTYGILFNNIDVVQLRGFSFDGISYSNTSDTITLLDITRSTTTVEPGLTGQLLYFKNNNTITSTNGATWDNENRVLSYKKVSLREVDISGYTFSQDNYRKTNISPLPSESSYNSMAIDGYTFNSNLARPTSTINGTTHQSALYINGISGGVTGRSIIYFGEKTGTYGTTFSPQTAGITFGSCCLPSGKCIEYATTQYCNSFLGSVFSAGISCEGSKCGFKSCCFYDIVSGGITCKDTNPDECARFLGITGTSLCISTTCSTSLCCTQPPGSPGSSSVQSSIIGACCISETIDGVVINDCILTNNSVCDGLFGTFLGPDTICDNCNEEQ
jgi:hypothetical protein